VKACPHNTAYVADCVDCVADRIAELERENLQLREQYADAVQADTTASARQIKNQASMIIDKDARIAELEAQLTEARSEIRERQTWLLDFKVEVERTKAELAEARENLIAEGQRLVREIRQQTDADLDAERAAHERTKAELDEVRENRGKVAVELLEKAQRERAEARAERDAAQAELADARASLAKVRHDRDEMIRVHDEVEAKRDALKAEAATLRVDRDEWKQQHENAIACWRRETAHFSSLHEAARAQAAVVCKILSRIAGMEAKGASINPGHYMHIAIRIAKAALRKLAALDEKDED
jgi:chromosome segregation ATPase